MSKYISRLNCQRITIRRRRSAQVRACAVDCSLIKMLFITFPLPFVLAVTVKNNKNEIISQREFLIKPGARCFCVWYCSCFCGNAYISADSHEECNAMSHTKAASAGFNREEIYDSVSHRFHFNIHSIFYTAWMVILFLLLCGELWLTIKSSWDENYPSMPSRPVHPLGKLNYNAVLVKI